MQYMHSIVEIDNEAVTVERNNRILHRQNAAETILEVELSPCPFCGSKAVGIKRTGLIFGFNGFMVRCDSCHLQMFGGVLTKLIGDGKTITTIDKTEEEITEVEKELVARWNNRAAK